MEGLRQFTAYGTTSDDEKAPGQRTKVPYRIGRVIGLIMQAWYLGHQRRATGRYNQVAGCKSLAIYPDFIRANDASRALDTVDSKCLITVYRVMGRNFFNHLLNAVHDVSKVEINAYRLESEVFCLARQGCCLRCADEGFAGDTTSVEAVATHSALFDQSYLCFNCSSNVG